MQFCQPLLLPHPTNTVFAVLLEQNALPVLFDSLLCLEVNIKGAV